MIAAEQRTDNKLWPWISAVLATLLTGIVVAGYSSARADVSSLSTQISAVTERVGVLEQTHKDVTRRLTHIEEQLDRLLMKR